MGDQYVKLVENKKIIYMDSTNLYGHSIGQPLPYDGIEMWHGHPDLYMNWLKEILNTRDDNDVGYFIEVDLRYPDDIIEKTKNFPFAPENKVILKDNYDDYMKKIKTKKFTEAKKLICDWSGKKNNSVKYRMLKVYVRHGVIIDKIYEIISFNPRKSLEKYIYFILQKRNRAKNDFEKDFYKLLINAFENCDSYLFRKNEVLMDKPIYLGFAVLELSK